MDFPRFFDRILLEKRNQLIAEGYIPYPYSYTFSHSIRKLLSEAKSLVYSNTKISTVGRVSSIRTTGKAVFLDLQKDGTRIQIYACYSEISQKEQTLLRSYLDSGDILRIEGVLFYTKMGELTIRMTAVEMLCKSVVRIPFGKNTDEKYYYRGDSAEIKYKERYTYWTISNEAKTLIETRFKIIRLIRDWMQGEDFLEVQTPTIEMIYGGAEARPFETNIWALDKQKAYLRISPELYLKRYIAGGFDKVFTICQNFRNEGIDKSHNPEFTMMEWYEAGTDYYYQMQRFEQLTEYLVQTIHGSTIIDYQGKRIDFTVPWRRLTVVDAIEQYVGIDVVNSSISSLQAVLKDHRIEVHDNASKGALIAAIFENLCEAHLIQPTFIIDHPKEISPLTKEKRGMSDFVERFEPFVNSMEIGNAYSEMTDPVLQYERFMDQRGRSESTDFVNHPVDIDFMKAIGVGLPPTGGVGYGIDRIIMIITNSENIRDIVPFPMMKPIKEN